MTGQADLLIERDATISECGQYRYRLTRAWGSGSRLPFVMLNPSTADALVDDPTITRCMERARRLGYDGIEVVNLFAFRATEPADMRAASDPVGPDNDEMLRDVFGGNPIALAAWGTHGTFRGRSERVRELAASVGCKLLALRLTKHGHPSHPLYLPFDIPREQWREVA